jgi:hypothetical protein
MRGENRKEREIERKKKYLELWMMRPTILYGKNIFLTKGKEFIKRKIK